MAATRVEIVTIGDELVEGRLVDTNAALMSERLLDRGLAVTAHHSVGDDPAEIVAILRAAAERAAFVVVSGGLGPTADDLTAAAAGEAFARPLRRSAEALEHTRDFFARRGREMPPTNTKQADLPAGAEIVPNPWGTAVGFSLIEGRCRLFFLPGVPRELEGMFSASVLPAIMAAARPEPAAVATVKIFGLGESDVAHRLEGLGDDLDGVSLLVQYRATFPEIHLRLVVTGGDAHILHRLVGEVRERLGPAVFACGDGGLATGFADVALAELAHRGLSLAVADGASAGYLGHQLGGSGGAAGVLSALVQAPDGDALAAALAVDAPADLEARVAVLARAVADRAGAGAGVAVLMVPLGGAEDGQAVWVAATVGAVERTRERRVPLELERCRQLAGWIALANLRRAVAGLSS